jgi:hypothetical protein
MNAALLQPVRPRPVATAKGRVPGAPELYSPDWFVRRQTANAARYLQGLAPFREDEFGTDAAAPSPAHIRAANRLVDEVRRKLAQEVARMRALAQDLQGGRGGAEPLLRLKDRVYAQTKEAERLMAFYRGIFDQRHARFGHMLLPIDRIARDCYQAVWAGLGKARSIPAPSPFAYVEDGNGPATYRRGVRLTTLGKRPNPFPLVKVPQHRLLNPWTLGAVPHEVAHNLQSDLGLWAKVPRRIEAAMKGKLPEDAIDVWRRWHKECYADFAGVLLIGPAYVESLIDVVGKSPQATAHFNPEGVHPTPILRVPINCHLLRRIGFEAEAEAFERTWAKLYPKVLLGKLPAEFRESYQQGCQLLVSAICFQPEVEYGGKPLARVVKFTRKDVTVISEAAERLVRGENTGILPERFLIPAARTAFRLGADNAALISRNFYFALGRT